jgi:transposase-like protein
MGRKRRPNEPPSYEPAPEVPAEMAERYQVITEVIGGKLSVSEGARRLGIARNNLQTLVHRAQAQVLEALAPRPSGRTPKPAREAELEAEVKRLAQHKAKLEEQLHTMDRLLGVAGDVIKGLRTPERKAPATPRSKRSLPSSPPGTEGSDPEDPEPAALLAKVAAVGEHGARAARAVGVGASTMREWRARQARGLPPRGRRGRAPARPSPTAAAEVRGLVRTLGGLVGAGALAKQVNGVSRRAAAALKADQLRLVEQERRAGSARVEVLVPGVVRGFDAMHLATTEGRHYALVAADASVPYRTSIPVVAAYDGPHVAAALDADFALHGAPLVCRLDRASCHKVEDVVSVCAGHSVLLLHGPPRHPGYYGQLERQNRDHRAWLDRLGPLPPDVLALACDEMRDALNRLWPRRTLGWRTPEAAWKERPPVNDNRTELYQEVTARAARLRAKGVNDDLAMRLAIEKALTNRGYLRITRPRVLCG